MDDVEYRFEAGGEACELCLALSGTTDQRPIPRPHPNCGCECKAVCNNKYSWNSSTRRYGPQGSCFEVLAEIAVECWDGSVIGESLPLDFGCVGADQDYDGWLESMWERTGEAAQKLEQGCPPCNPPLVS